MFHPTPRRRFLMAAPMVLASRAARAQPGWPNRSLTLILPFAAGSSSDVLARLLADRLSAGLGQPVVVQNVPGASATLGVDRVAKSLPDGYTLGLSGDGSLVVRVSMDPPVPYDPLRDLAPISQLLRTRNLLVVHPSVPAANLAELIALARARPGALSYAHSGIGFSTHLGMEMLKQAAGIDIVGVPYANEGAMFTDLLQGRVQIMIGSGMSTIRRVKDGTVRALVVTSRERAPVLPDVPTVEESGFPGFEAVAWFGLVAPAQTPSPVLKRVQQEAVAAMAEPVFAQRLDEMGLVVIGSTPDAFAALLPKEIERMAGVLRPLGLLRAS